ncbi:MAG: DUF3109 family protein [Cytophagales bacterium]|jgi:hypothetical protein|nr:DUF3109 family protein [Cytophagales bacterium]
MIIVGNTYLSDDVAEKQFVCDLEKCKGACCVEGDAGAPLDEEELAILEKIYPEVAPYLSEAGRKAIAEQGTWTVDQDGDYTTPTVGNRECAYAIYDEKGILKCGIEQAYLDGKVDFPKPISCHLYPVRITKYDQWDAVNYHRWHICDPACRLGEALKVPVYKFLRNALVRKYGQAWYDELEKTVNGASPQPPPREGA